jgi:fluoride exporter
LKLNLKTSNPKMIQLFYVGLGGCLGAIARYLTCKYITSFYQTVSFPLGTFIVNVVGSFLIGILSSYVSFQLPSQNEFYKFFLITGVLGGFTTFSAFSLETILLLQSGAYSSAFYYVASSLLFCFIGTALGIYIYNQCLMHH